MANATLVITVTIPNGGGSRQAELSIAQRAAEAALQQARSAGGATLSGTAYTDGGAATANGNAAWVYTPVASS